MAKRKKTAGKNREFNDYRHEEAKRKNNPPAKIAADGRVPIIPKAEYAYNPHRPPLLRFDPDGSPDQLPELLHTARKRALTKDEAATLAGALRVQEPWLEWAGKRESQAAGFAVDPVALHIHERVSAQAILKVAARQDIQRDLFADPQQEYHEAVQFYQHDIDWTNRLILGDSLQVMSSLARRDNLAGKVQMIYIDPPYGIKFASNFQPEVGKRDVKDREQDLTREPEMVKAYRDTWHLGVHSYLSYLRDRLLVAKELLADTGSIFVQIGEENLHSVRFLLEEVFGQDNFCGLVCYGKTSGLGSKLLYGVFDYILWFAKQKRQVKYCQLFYMKVAGEAGATKYLTVAMRNGQQFPLRGGTVPDGGRLMRLGGMSSQGNPVFPFNYQGHSYEDQWKTNASGLSRLAAAERLQPMKTTLSYVRYIDDFPASPITNSWYDVGGIQSRSDPKVYVVQTSTTAIQRCMLMTTDPGDLVLDPMCGSGTTAYVAEQWGRRWITIDTSRVAVAIARQRLLTAKYDYHELRAVNSEDRQRNPRGTWLTDGTRTIDGPCTFDCKTVPHITLKSIAQNTNLDPIFAKHEPILNGVLASCNTALGKVTDAQRTRLLQKLAAREKNEGKKAVTDADQRRWELPKKGTKWEHWQVPFDTDPDWPKPLADAVTEYRKAWRAKMDEVNACIEANTPQEELVDQPEIVKGVVRVSGPFTVEAVQPPEMSLGDVAEPEGKFAGEPEELAPTFVDGSEGPMTTPPRFVETRPEYDVKNVDAYLDSMMRLLKVDGVRFPNNRQMKFSRLDRLTGASAGLHAEGRWTLEGEKDTDPDGKATVVVAFGPQYGSVTAKMVEDVVRSANRRGYDDLVIAGFDFDGPAQAAIDEAQHPNLNLHAAHVAPSVNPAMNGLLKEQPGSQLFTVFGRPRTRLDGPDKDGMYTVTMEGVDIYNPVENVIVPTGAEKVAAWFIDSDYDGWTFCITQAFFPDRSAWKKLSRALNGPGGVIDEDRFGALSGTTSLPFPAGEHKRVAVKVIDPRGVEVMRVHELGK